MCRLAAALDANAGAGAGGRVKIGLIGYGFMGGAHLAAMQAMAGVKVVAVASRTRPTAGGPARGNLDLKSGPLPETVRWTPEWEEIVRDPDVDAVDICLPTQMHKRVVLRALAEGKHVLCEKPMALTTVECDELLRAAEATGRVFMVAQVMRFMFPYRRAAEFVRSVGAGAVRACELRRSTGFPQWSEWLANADASGGAILDLLSHDLDQVLLWFGDPASVRAVSLGEVDTAQATMRYEGGLEVTVRGGWLTPEVAFSAGFAIRTDEASLRFAEGKLLLERDGVVEEIAVPEQDAYAEEIGYFAECCRSGAAAVLCPPAESARAVRLARLVKRSRDEGERELAWQ